jgi:hypothetical protein
MRQQRVMNQDCNGLVYVSRLVWFQVRCQQCPQPGATGRGIATSAAKVH